MVGSLRVFASLALALVSAAGCGGAAPPPADGPANAPPPAPAASAQAEETPPARWPFVPKQTEEERAAQIERLTKDPGPLKSNGVPPGERERYGHAEGLINAPPDRVKARLENFSKYKELAGPRFRTVRVVDKQGRATDVYFQLPIMKGLVTIHYVTRLLPAKAVQGGNVVEGTFVKGNIKSMHIAFTVRPGPDERSSIMVCDLLLLPNVPAPQSAVDEELRDACGDAINNVKQTLAPATP